MRKSPIEELPKDLKIKYLSYLEIDELRRLALVSKSLKQKSEDNELWNKLLLPNHQIELPGEPGAAKQSFFDKIASRKTRYLHYDQAGNKYMGQICYDGPDDIFIKTEPDHDRGWKFLVDRGLLLQEQANAMAATDYFILEVLLSHRGLRSLEEKRIIFEQVGDAYDLKMQIAIGNKWITPEQADAMEVENLDALLTEEGMIALEKKLITPKQAHSMEEMNLDVLLSEEGLIALKKKTDNPRASRCNGA